MKAFEEWWQVVPVEYTDVVNEDVAKAAYKAGMLRAAEIAEVVDAQCTNDRTDHCEGWNASECPDKSVAFCISTAIRKEANSGGTEGS